MHPILKASRKILTFKYYAKFAFIQIRDSMGAHQIFFIIFTLFSCIILTNQSLPWYSLWSGFQCDTKMAAVFSCMRPAYNHIGSISKVNAPQLLLPPGGQNCQMPIQVFECYYNFRLHSFYLLTCLHFNIQAKIIKFKHFKDRQRWFGPD